MKLNAVREKYEKGGEVRLVVFHEFNDNLYVIVE